MVLDVLKENKTVEKAVDWFIKISTGIGITILVFTFLEKFLGFTFDFSMGLGL